jgi:hypothetical protein
VDKRSRIILIAFAIVVIGAFLAITIPQYTASLRLNSDLATAHNRIDHLEQQLRLAEIRGAGGMLYIEVSRRNWGTASRYASAFFEQARQLASITPDASLRNKLQSLGQQREAVFGALARSDPSVQDVVGGLLDSLPRAGS